MTAWVGIQEAMVHSIICRLGTLCLSLSTYFKFLRVCIQAEALFCDSAEQGIPPEDGLILRLGVVHPALNKIFTSPILVSAAGLNTLKPLGLGSNSGLTCLRRFSHPHAICCCVLRLIDKVAPKSSLNKATSSISPDWSFLPSH